MALKKHRNQRGPNSKGDLSLAIRAGHAYGDIGVFFFSKKHANQNAQFHVFLNISDVNESGSSLCNLQ